MRRKSRRHFPIWSTLILALGVASLTSPGPLSASLGGDVTSVQADQAKLQASLQTSSKNGYEIHEMRAQNNVVVREYESGGKVFGVAWQGPTRPDLQQLLGTYFQQFTQAAQAQKAQRKARGPLTINEPGLVVQMAGHMRSFVGRAYVPGMLPSGVQAQEIQ
jgi:Protein of unknown function (DUF2844)